METMAMQMAQIMAQMAALQEELQSTKAQNAELNSRLNEVAFGGKRLDEDALVYTPEEIAARAAAAKGAPPTAPGIPASFLLTPQQGRVDHGAGVAGGSHLPEDPSTGAQPQLSSKDGSTGAAPNQC